MDVRPEFVGLVLACALVTAVPRVLPPLVLSRMQLPQWLLDWLRYVPVAVLAALLSLEITGWEISSRPRREMPALAACFGSVFLALIDPVRGGQPGTQAPYGK